MVWTLVSLAGWLLVGSLGSLAVGAARSVSTGEAGKSVQLLYRVATSTFAVALLFTVAALVICERAGISPLTVLEMLVAVVIAAPLAAASISLYAAPLAVPLFGGLFLLRLITKRLRR